MPNPLRVPLLPINMESECSRRKRIVECFLAGQPVSDVTGSRQPYRTFECIRITILQPKQLRQTELKAAMNARRLEAFEQIRFLGNPRCLRRTACIKPRQK